MIRIMETKNEFKPKRSILPGSVLKLEIEERGIKQKDFAAEIGIPASNLNEYISGKRNFTAEFSLKLESALGIPANNWMNLQQNHDLALARNKDLDIKEQEASNELNEYERIISVKSLIKRLGINSVTHSSILSQLRSKLNLSSVAELQVKYNPVNSKLSLFKKSAKVNADPILVLTWTLLAKAEVKKVGVSGIFDFSKRAELINNLKTVFHKNEDTINQVREILSQNGIKFCIVEKLDSTPIDGYTFYDEGTPCIVVTKRYNRIDNFAFAIMHELGHIFLHLSKDQDGEYITIEEKERMDKIEKEADKFASDNLIPENIWRKTPEVRMNRFLIQKRYSEWAENYNLNKWIVLGRIGHELNLWQFKDDGTRRLT